MSKPDFYETLGVERGVDTSDLKRAYRKKAMKYHPDRNQGDAEAEDKFKRVAEAYEILKDPDTRAVYDQYGHEGLERQGGGGGRGGFEDAFSQFGDIFGDIFGGGGGRRRAQRGADLRYDLTLSFREAAFGLEREITFHRMEGCGTCEGSGAKPGTKPQRCSTCGGAGRVQRQQGFFMVQTACPSCRGKGQIVRDPCKTCDGAGQERKERTVSVKIPAGVDDGVRMRVGGEGEAGPNGAGRGDLYVFIAVEGDEDFVRDGADVHATLEISMSQAALGAVLQTKTLHGAQDVTLPPGTQPDTVVRLRGKGIRKLQRSGSGDHFITITVVVPASLTADQRALIEQLAEAGL